MDRKYFPVYFASSNGIDYADYQALSNARMLEGGIYDRSCPGRFQTRRISRKDPNSTPRRFNVEVRDSTAQLRQNSVLFHYHSSRQPCGYYGYAPYSYPL
jgi:hypothetical protein